MRIRHGRTATGILLALLLVSLCFGQARSNSDSPASVDARPAQDSATSAKKNAPDYVIGTDDVLAINVWKEPEFSHPVQVRSDGDISLPLIGELKAAGKTPLELQQDITTKLSTYFKEPDVTVMVTEMNSRKFNILGRVRKPGSYSLAATKTVLDAIAEAGGFQDFAKIKDIFILRQGADGKQVRLPFNYKDVIHGKHIDENITLKPHDTIIVP
jgi:polysaccharide biosynthesis/export protein